MYLQREQRFTADRHARDREQRVRVLLLRVVFAGGDAEHGEERESGEVGWREENGLSAEDMLNEDESSSSFDLINRISSFEFRN